MKILIDRFSEKFFSGKFLWSVGTLAVFVVLSVTGKMDPAFVTNTIMLVVGAYFGKNMTNGDPK